MNFLESRYALQIRGSPRIRARRICEHHSTWVRILCLVKFPEDVDDASILLHILLKLGPHGLQLRQQRIPDIEVLGKQVCDRLSSSVCHMLVEAALA